MRFLDTEGCGFHGPTALIQYADEDGPIKLYDVWFEPIEKTMELLEETVSKVICGFNLVFDWFHIQQLHNTFAEYLKQGGKGYEYPIDHVDDIAVVQKDARLGLCLKPAGALDLMLIARKGKYQSLMDREEIKIKKIPSVIAFRLAEQLEKRVLLDDIYFSRRKDKKASKWSVRDHKDRETGVIDPNFKDVVLKFAASSGLKNLARFALNEDVQHEFSCPYSPKEVGWAPFAGALGGTPSDWKGEWPEIMKKVAEYWRYDDDARKYAEMDIVYTRKLWPHLGSPEANDVDSVLACMVGSVRWRGFEINPDKINKIKTEALERIKNTPQAPHVVKAWLHEVMSEDEKVAMGPSTKKVVLQSIAEWKIDAPAEPAPEEDPDLFDDGLSDVQGEEEEIEFTPAPKNAHPAALRAKAVLEARMARNLVTMLDKLLQAGRFHASLNVIGTLSSRMSGGDGLNAQGIKKVKDIRECFTIHDDIQRLVPTKSAEELLDSMEGGDFSAFEVVIAIANYNDPKLSAAVESGKKVHAIFGQKLFPEYTYDQIVATDGQDPDLYTKGKSGFFAMIYMGDANTLKTKLGVPIEQARKAHEGFLHDFPGVAAAIRRITERFCSMRQPKGIGTKVEWHDPADYVESMFGFRRYFTLENMICKALFDLAQDPPKELMESKIKVVRRDRLQTVGGACQSALYGAAFAIQSGNVRAAGNHEVQSAGATMTKGVQAELWKLQPSGISPWLIQLLNIHDEIIAALAKSLRGKCNEIVQSKIKFYKAKVPLLKMAWKENVPNWGALK